jgi:Response regulator containing CheY-like receiver, AAA-type ATPase, and DNA-binding domains
MNPAPEPLPDLSSLHVWVVDDDESIRWVLERSLTRAGMAVQTFPGVAELMDALQDDTPNVLISDIRMPGIDGLELMQRVHTAHPELPVIIITAHSDLDAAVAAYRGGAFEYLPKPVRRRGHHLTRAARRQRPPRAPGRDRRTAAQRDHRRGAGDAGRFRAIGRLAQSQITVLITGESGSGKEVIARALHDNSPRAGKPFVAVNTAAIPKDLMESEFFGHERGAFTGAATQRRGRFEQADGGTLFLDEIGDMPADLQTRPAARAPGWPVLPRRRCQLGAGRRARHRRHPPEPRTGGARRALPRGPVPPHQRHPPACAGAA